MNRPPGANRVDFWHHFPKDGEWRKVTLRSREEHELQLQPMCKACQHRGEIFTPTAFSERYGVPMDMPIIQVQTRLRCRKCSLPAGYFHWWDPAIPRHTGR